MQRYLRNEAELGFNRGEGMTRLSVKRGKGNERRRGSSRRRGGMLPRLARWAGVGVFIFGLFLLSCENDTGGPTEPGEGVVYVIVWSAQDTTLSAVKLDASSGARLGVYPVKDYKRDELRAVAVNRLNGDVYFAFMRGFVRMGPKGRIYFDREFFLYSIYADNEVLVDAGANRVWVYDGGEFYLHAADTGDQLKTIRPIGKGAVSEYDNTLVAAASPRPATELLKLSKDGEEVWRRGISVEKRTCACVAVDPTDGTIYVISYNERPPNPNIYLQKVTSDGKVVFEKEITPRFPKRGEVSIFDSTFWCTSGYAYHISGEGEIIKEWKDKLYYRLALSRVSNKIFIKVYDTSPLIIAMDTKTYREIWRVRFDKTMWTLGGWANPQ